MGQTRRILQFCSGAGFLRLHRGLPWSRTAYSVVVAGLLVACSSQTENDTTSTTGVSDPAAAAAASGPPDTVDVAASPSDDAAADQDDPDELDLIDPLDIAGEIVNEYSLVQGDCFNRFEGLREGQRLAITARVGCDEPHWGEVYHTFEFEAPHPSVYPGDDAVRDYALRICYDHFEDFVEEKYELSDYDIGVFTPNRTNFEHEQARYRGVHCWLYHLDAETVSGSAEGVGT